MTHRFLRVFAPLCLCVLTIVSAAAQSKPMLPFDHIHLNEPAADASAWWEKNIPGGRRIMESPNRIMYGAVRLMFLAAKSSGGSQGSVIEPALPGRPSRDSIGVVRLGPHTGYIGGDRVLPHEHVLGVLADARVERRQHRQQDDERGHRDQRVSNRSSHAQP